MSRAAQKLISASGGKAYEIEQSLMFNREDTPSLERTPSSAGNRRTWTFSAWIKRIKRSTSHAFFAAYAGSSGSDANWNWNAINNNDQLQVGGWDQNWRVTNRLFRDFGAWYHIVIAFDTTQATSGDRVKVYVNGVEETSFATSNNPDQNEELGINSTIEHQIGAQNYSTRNCFDGYMAEINFIDGSQLTASSFGETDSETGQWIPKKPSGLTYGTNGFYMPFKKNDRYSPYFNANASSGILTADHADFDVGSGNFTMECWFYVDEYAGNYRRVFGKSSTSGANADTQYQVDIDSNNQPVSYIYDAADNGTTYLTLQSSTAITDNKWHHVALVRNGTAFNLYLDGTSVANATSSMTVNNDTHQFGIGRVGEYTGQIFKGWISNFRYVKGTAVYTSNFTPPTSPLTAITNTKLLCCQDATITTENSGTSKTLTVTAAQVTTQQMSPFTYDWYQDQSGQDNDYQPDNLTVNDVMLDSPTNNFAIMNPLVVTGADGITFKQGALQPVSGGAFAKSISSFAPSSGKWYCEYHVDATYTNFGGVGATTLNDMSQSHIGYSTGETHWIIKHDTATSQTVKVDNVSTGASSLGSVSVGDIIGLSLDADNGKIYFRKNNSVIGTSTGYAITDVGTGNYWFVAYIRSQGAYGYGTFNFGQNGTFCGSVNAQGNTDGNGIGDFYYSPPSGFKALCTKNLPTPAVKKSTDHFNTVLYTGSDNDAVSQSVTGVGFEPDLVIIKKRNASASPAWWDQVRGEHKGLNSDGDDAEITDTYGLETFDSDGFTVRESQSAQGQVNTGTLVAWNWKANGSGSANNSGDINAIVSANPTAGFSIVSWTGDGSNGNTVAHGLGKEPQAIFYKRRDTASSWYMVTKEIDGSQDYLSLNSTTFAAASESYGNPTTSTISNWTWGANAIIAYCFAEVEGFSKIGVYESNGNVNGPFIHTGFTPAWIMFKYVDGAGESWWMLDSTRDTINPTTEVLYANLTAAESSIGGSGSVDFLSNGFKIRATNGGINSANTYFYMAFAEFPFKYANAR